MILAGSRSELAQLGRSTQTRLIANGPRKVVDVALMSVAPRRRHLSYHELSGDISPHGIQAAKGPSRAVHTSLKNFLCICLHTTGYLSVQGPVQSTNHKLIIRPWRLVSSNKTQLTCTIDEGDDLYSAFNHSPTSKHEQHASRMSFLPPFAVRSHAHRHDVQTQPHFPTTGTKHCEHRCSPTGLTSANPPREAPKG
jgi:hypothetical protein